jgi:hypothetical protein
MTITVEKTNEGEKNRRSVVAKTTVVARKSNEDGKNRRPTPTTKHGTSTSTWDDPLSPLLLAVLPSEWAQ